MGPACGGPAPASSYDVEVGVTNLGTRSAPVAVTLRQDGRVVARRRATAAPGRAVRVSLDEVPMAEGPVEARLEAPEDQDHLQADSVAWATAGAVPLRIGLLDADPPGPLGKVLGLMHGVTVETLHLPDARLSGPGFDAVVSDGVLHPALAGVDALVFLPPPEAGPTGPLAASGPLPGARPDPGLDVGWWTSGRTVSRPVPVNAAGGHALLDHLDLRDVAWGELTLPAVHPGDEVVVGSDDGPLVIARDRVGIRQVVCAINTARSDLALRVAFPVLVANCLDWIAGGQPGAGGRGRRPGGSRIIRTGQDLRLRRGAPGERGVASVAGPDGRPIALPPPVAGDVARVPASCFPRAGLYTLRAGGERPDAPGGRGGAYGAAPETIAANLTSAEESSIVPVRGRVFSGRHGRHGRPGETGNDALLAGAPTWLVPWLLLFAIGLMAMEWAVWSRLGG
jgi:hypothetical protein